MSSPLALTFFLVFVSSLLGSGQVPDAPKPPVAEPVDQALAIYEKAAKTQAPPEYSSPGAIRDLTVRIQGEVWDYSKEPVQKLSLGVSRYLQLEPERFRSEWRTNVDKQTYGYDGKRYWYSDSDGSRWLGGSTYKKDIQRVRDEIDETRYLLRFFFLANLQGPKVVFTKKPDEKIVAFAKERLCHVLDRSNENPASTEPPLTLYIDTETFELLGATAHATEAGQKSLIFKFRYDQRIQPKVKGVLFPFKIEIREKPFGAENSRLSSVATLIEERGVEFNTDLVPETFERPRPKPRDK